MPSMCCTSWYGKVYAWLALGSGLLAILWGALLQPQSNPARFPMTFYSQLIGQLDGRSCPSYPVCSVYASQAFSRHGVWLGSWLVLDRLIHESDDIHLAQVVRIEGVDRVFDPLERNDFWLNDKQRLDSIKQE